MSQQLAQAIYFSVACIGTEDEPKGTVDKTRGLLEAASISFSEDEWLALLLTVRDSSEHANIIQAKEALGQHFRSL